MRTRSVVFLLVFLAACSSPADPCDLNGPNLGIPEFDFLGSLRARGAEVTELGERADGRGFSVPTRVMTVDGEEVLRWAHCSGATYVRDIGLLGIGVEARNPPVIALGADDHVFTVSRTLIWYAGTDSAVVQLLTDVVGPEISVD